MKHHPHHAIAINFACFVPLAALLCIAAPARAGFIDSFAVGPQSGSLGPGDSYWGETLGELDPAQVLGGGRRLTLLADEDAPFRGLEEGSFSATLSGSTPGSLNIQAAVTTPPEASSYEPAFLLDYDCLPADWSAFDRIVVRFNSPPTEDVSVETSINSGGDAFWSDTSVPAGSQSATILFSGLNDSGPVTLAGVTSLRLKWILPAVTSLELLDVQVAGASAPELPRLNLSVSNGATLSWPTNAAGFLLESSTNLASAFTTVTNEPAVVGTNFSVTLPADRPAKFFRLHKP